MKAKFINEFTRNSDPLETLGIGYTAKIYKFFDDLKISRDDYTIEDKNIIFGTNLYLNSRKFLVELPDNLIVYGRLNLDSCTSLSKLPDNLIVGEWLELTDCKLLVKLSDNILVGTSLFLNGCTLLKELPDNLKVKRFIFVNNDQTELIKWLRTSKYWSQVTIEPTI